MEKIVFVTHNQGKITSANRDFEGKIEFEIYDYDIQEIRGTLDEIAIAKVKDAYKLTGKPTIALDSGFFIPSLNGFPGVYVNHILDTIGVNGILKLLEDSIHRDCEFKETLAYYDGVNEPVLFHGVYKGNVALIKKGIVSAKDWSTLSYIYMPLGYNKTLAQMSEAERLENAKNNSMNNAFYKFKEWYLNHD